MPEFRKEVVKILIGELQKACHEGCNRCQDGYSVKQFANGQIYHPYRHPQETGREYTRDCLMAKTQQRILEWQQALS